MDQSITTENAMAAYTKPEIKSLGLLFDFTLGGSGGAGEPTYVYVTPTS